MSDLHVLVASEALPSGAQELLKPYQNLPKNIIFFQRVPATILRFILAFCIGIPFALAAVAFTYFFFKEMGAGTLKIFDGIISVLFIFLSYAITWFFYDWCSEGLKINRLIKRQQWRQGFMLCQNHLLVQLSDHECYLLPKEDIQGIEKVKIKTEKGGFYWQIEIYYGEEYKMVVSENDFELFNPKSELAKHGLHEFIKLYETLERWYQGKMTQLYPLKLE